MLRSKKNSLGGFVWNSFFLSFFLIVNESFSAVGVAYYNITDIKLVTRGTESTSESWSGVSILGTIAKCTGMSLSSSPTCDASYPGGIELWVQARVSTLVVATGTTYYTMPFESLAAECMKLALLAMTNGYTLIIYRGPSAPDTGAVSLLTGGLNITSFKQRLGTPLIVGTPTTNLGTDQDIQCSIRKPWSLALKYVLILGIFHNIDADFLLFLNPMKIKRSSQKQMAAVQTFFAGTLYCTLSWSPSRTALPKPSEETV